MVPELKILCKKVFPECCENGFVSVVRDDKKSPHGDKKEVAPTFIRGGVCFFCIPVSGKSSFSALLFSFFKVGFMWKTVSYGDGKERFAPFLCGKT